MIWMVLSSFVQRRLPVDMPIDMPNRGASNENLSSFMFGDLFLTVGGIHFLVHSTDTLRASRCGTKLACITLSSVEVT